MKPSDRRTGQLDRDLFVESLPGVDDPLVFVEKCSPWLERKEVTDALSYGGFTVDGQPSLRTSVYVRVTKVDDFAHFVAHALENEKRIDASFGRRPKPRL